ncbi:MAG: hypothetical protein WCI18_06410 [Pseudomonadota bacterium]
MKSFALAFFSLALSNSAWAGTILDQFTCRLQWQDSATGEVNAITQNITSPRAFFNYPAIRGHNVLAFQGEIPVTLELGTTRINARFIYRHALDIGAMGLATDAAQWQCSAIEMRRDDESAQKTCVDEQIKKNPFEDPTGRWEPTTFHGVQADWLKTAVLKTDLTTPWGGAASMECTHLGILR